jgi:hypothetical protein
MNCLHYLSFVAFVLNYSMHMAKYGIGDGGFLNSNPDIDNYEFCLYKV